MTANPLEITKSAVGGAYKAGRWAAGQGVGALQRIAGRGPTGGSPKDLDDVTIARKVETVVFRPAGRPKGKIDVNVVDGVVWLRGEVKSPDDVNAIEAEARAIPEVREVQNLLHLPKTPARTRASTPRRQQATRRKAAAPRKPRTEPRRVSSDKTVATGEPLPKDLAAEGEGRQPAPLGSEDRGGEPAAETARATAGAEGETGGEGTPGASTGGATGGTSGTSGG